MPDDFVTAMVEVPGALRREGVVDAARHIRVLVLDVDGVCTDGKLYMNEHGQAQKAFFARDGLAIKTALKAGLGIAVITGRDDPCVRARMDYLGVTEYHAGDSAKLTALERIRANGGLQLSEMAFLGDDWIDLDPMRAVGLPMAVADAAAQVQAEAMYVTAARGGYGAVREAVEFLLAARGDGNPADFWTVRSTAEVWGV